MDGPVDKAIGMIWDVAVDESGRAYVLDRAFQTVRVFTHDGRPLYQVGRAGSGPLDLRAPLAVWPDSSGVTVPDAVLGIKAIRVGADGVSTLSRVIRLETPPMAVCRLGSGFASLSPTMDSVSALDQKGKLVRVHDNTGRAVRQFGESYGSEQALVRLIMSEGTLACTTDRIILALAKLPFVRAFDAEGRQSWIVRFTDFQIGASLEQVDSRGRLTIGLDPANPTNSTVLRITRIEPLAVAVQVALMTKESIADRSIWSRIDTYLIDIRTGRGVFVGDRLPLLAGVWKNRAYGFSNDPFPRVIILQLPGR